MIEAMLEHALAGRIRPASAPFESAFDGHWHTERLGHHEPVVSALRGGLLSDRLAWVFAAGYQAAIRVIFPDVHPEGWAAYSAAEDAENLADRPGTRITPNRRRWLDHLWSQKLDWRFAAGQSSDRHCPRHRQ